MRQRRPSPATVIACLAVFVALGGTALAAGSYLITRTSQIKPSVLRALEGPRGPEMRVSSEKMSVKPGQDLDATRAECPQSYHVVTGGYYAELASGAYVVSSEPYGGTGWSVVVSDERSTAATNAWADALCAPGRTNVQLSN